MNAFNYLVVNLTSRCNTICKYCFQAADSFKNGEDYITFKVFKKIIDYCNPKADINDRKIVHFTGGEPLVNKDFFLMLEYAIEAGYVIRIQTNGILLNECKEEQLRLLAHPMVTMKISLDGTTPEQHEFLRQPGTFEKVVSAIKIATRYNKMVGLKTCIHSKNINHFKELLDFCIDNGIAGFSYNVIRKEGYAERLDPSCYEGIDELEVVKRLVPLYNEKKYQFLLNGNQISMYYFAHHTGIACGAQFYIDYDGKIYSYQQCTPEQYIGDLQNDDWNIAFDAQKAQDLEYIIQTTEKVVKYVKNNLKLEMRKNV